MSNNRLVELIASDWGRPVETDASADVPAPPPLPLWRRPRVQTGTLVLLLLALTGALIWQLAPLLFRGTPLAAQPAERRLGYVVDHQWISSEHLMVSVQDDVSLRWITVEEGVPWSLGATAYTHCRNGAVYVRVDRGTRFARVVGAPPDLCPVNW